MLCTSACLKSSGTTPEDRLLLMTADVPTVGKTSLNSRGGTASFGEPEGFKLPTISCKKVSQAQTGQAHQSRGQRLRGHKQTVILEP